MEVLDSRPMIGFLFLSGNGQQKAVVGEGGWEKAGRGGQSVGKPGDSAGRLLNPWRWLSDWANLFVLTLSLSYTLLCPPKILPVK